jgi:ribosome biogenesis GTPase A
MTLSHINWYPGHMKKTRDLIRDNLKMVDAAVEVVDARIPVSSRNPIIDELLQDKIRILAFNKSDLADETATKEWIRKFKDQGISAIPLNSMTGTGIPNFMRFLQETEAERNRDRLRHKPLRMMIVGVPNVGKSSLINRLTGSKSASTGDRPGVTRGKQWLSLENGMQLLDTPGILWPKFEDPNVGKNLAYCGSIKDEILDLPTLALELIQVLEEGYSQLLIRRYRLDGLGETSLETMEMIAINRGFILPGKRIDYERTARTLLDEFRSGAIGRITLERAIQSEKNA